MLESVLDRLLLITYVCQAQFQSIRGLKTHGRHFDGLVIVSSLLSARLIYSAFYGLFCHWRSLQAVLGIKCLETRRQNTPAAELVYERSAKTRLQQS